jgi:hypothetical protein
MGYLSTKKSKYLFTFFIGKTILFFFNLKKIFFYLQKIIKLLSLLLKYKINYTLINVTEKKKIQSILLS